MMGFKPSSLLILLLLFPFSVWMVSVSGTGNETIDIGAIIDLNSRAGKEHKVALEIAVQKFNDHSMTQHISVHFRNASMDPVQAVFAADELVRGKQVKAIIGMNTWEEASLVAEVVAKRAEMVPVLSLAASSGKPERVQLQWPFLVQMTANSSEQVKCIAAVIHSWSWRKVVVIYEDGLYGADAGMLGALSDSLEDIGVDIEYHLILPEFSSLSEDSERIVRGEVLKLLEKQSRVFIVLRSSEMMAGFLFREAKEIGLMGRESVWLLADSVSDLLDSVGTSFALSVQGALGIKNHYVETTKPFQNFQTQFQKLFRSEFPDEDHSKPGIHALQAYDSMNTIAQAIMNLSKNNVVDSKSLLTRILSSNFTGLSGDVHFQHGARSQQVSIFRIVNVVGLKYKELGFWSSDHGFSDSLEDGSSSGGIQELSSLVNWPGELGRVPKGWAMPTNAKPLIIGVPGRTVFDKFVKVDWAEIPHKYTGFCICVFEKVLEILEKNYIVNYEFKPYNGTYPDLVHFVANKTYDAIVGDITILAERSKDMDFTQPYVESGLTMIVPVKNDKSKRAWMFLKPFTRNMWVVTSAILFYTMFIIWFLEHQSNESFRGARRDQLGVALWFTFSSLFFAQKEELKSNYTKLVVIVWLFVVFVLTSSYQASLTSMLTVSRLEPSVTDIDWIKKTNAPVGCDGDSFVKDYLRNVLKLKNITIVGNQYDYPELLKNGSIKAAFLELPYAKLFLKEYNNDFTSAGVTYRFGGLGFAFQKGSPLARDFSEAILTLLENGTMQKLEEEWLGSSKTLVNNDASAKTQSLSLSSFWGLYLLTGATSTICFLIFVCRLFLRKSRKLSQVHDENEPKTEQVARPASLMKTATFGHIDRLRSSEWELVSPSDTSEMFDASHPAEIQITTMN
nr:glutamate receptor 2.9-like [Ipomoea batatas]GME01449.1 glutamate receptor 2.9-like [Ipomoea batatas]GME20261.1 glutamate receptor 2.9-like [Ipomoea batatas]